MIDRSTRRTIAWWLVLAAALWFLNGPIGLVVAIAIGVYDRIGIGPRPLTAIGAALIAAAPVAMMVEGLADPSTLDPRIVQRWAMANDLAFAGFACVIVGVLRSVDTGPLFGRVTARAVAAPAAATTSGTVVVDRSADVGTAPVHQDVTPPAASPAVSSTDTDTDTDVDVDVDVDRHPHPVEPEAGGRAHLVRGSVWTTANVIVQGVTGAAFWFLASKVYDVNAFGLASALFSSLLLVNFLTGMGLPVTLPLYAAGTRHRDNSIFTAALLYTTATALIGSVLYLAVVSSEAVELLRTKGGVAGWFVFFLAVAGAGIGALVDVRLMIARRWSLVAVRNGVVGIVRIALVYVAPQGDPALWLFGVGGLPVTVASVLALGLLPRVTGIRYALLPLDTGRLVEAWRFASVSFVGTLLSQTPTFLLPVIVLNVVTPGDYAQFFLAWSAASAVFIFPVSLAGVLLVEFARYTEREARVRYLETLAMALGVMLIAAGLSTLARPVAITVLPAFEPAFDLLPLLVAGSLPWAYTSVAIARARARKDMTTVTWCTATLCLVVIGLALVLVPGAGGRGAIAAWSAGQLAAAIVAAVAGRRFDRRSHTPAVGTTEDEGGRPGDAADAAVPT